MGMLRKAMSMSTIGLVDFRSDKERTAAYTHGALQQQKKQTRLMQQQANQQQYAPQPQYAPVLAPQPGWVQDPVDSRYVRWFDGYQLTGEPVLKQ